MNINKLMRDAWKAFPDTIGEVLSKGVFKTRRFQQFISNKLVDGIRKGKGRFIVSVPPQHGKSEQCSHWLPVWFLEENPRKNVVVTSYEYKNAAKWGRKVRNTIDQNSDKLTVRLSDDSTARGRWNTSLDGGMLCAGVCGPLTGNPGDLIIVDDPHKDWKEAQSETRRDDIIDWFNSVAYTRQQPDTTFIVIQTRWHERDLAGYLLKEHDDNWEEIRLPALAHDNDLLGRKKGEALCPELFNEEVLASIQRTIGAQMWSCIYDQSPTAAAGNIFLRKYWRRFSTVSEVFTRIIQSWDTAYETKKASAYSTCTTWGENSHGLFWLDMYRDKIDFPELETKMKGMAEQWKPNAILLEDKASGISLRQVIKKNTRLPIIEVSPQGDKVSRYHACTPYISSGRVFVPNDTECPWVSGTIEGMAGVPFNDWKDVADTVAQVILYSVTGACVSAGDIQSRSMRAWSNLVGGFYKFNGVSIHDFK